MSIRTGVIVSVALHEVYYTPNAKTCTKCDYKCLKYAYCAVKKSHDNSSIKVVFGFRQFLMLPIRVYKLHAKARRLTFAMWPHVPQITNFSEFVAIE